jgi:hypothetical protein
MGILGDFFKRLVQLSAISDNVSRPREVVKPANWVLSAKIEVYSWK